MNLKVLPPHVNHSSYQFTVLDERTIVYGLGAIKGVGENAVDSIINARNQSGPFKNFFDFCLRVDLRKVNRRVIEASIKSGALDNLDAQRASMMASLDRALAFAEQRSKVKEQGQDDLFAFDSEEDSNFAGCELVNVPEWNTHQRLLGEKETLGFYLSGHPLERYAAELSHITKQSISALVPMRDKTLMIAGLVVQVRKLQTKNGDPMAILTLEDSSGRVDVTVFSDLYVSSKNLLEKDQILVVQGEASVDNFSGGIRFTARRLWSIEQARMTFSKAIKLTLEKHMISSEFLDKLQGLFQPFKQGKCPIVIEYRCEDATAQLNLSQQWLINPADQLLDHLHTLLGQQQVSVIY